MTIAYDNFYSDDDSSLRFAKSYLDAGYSPIPIKPDPKFRAIVVGRICALSKTSWPRVFGPAPMSECSWVSPLVAWSMLT